MSAVADGVPIGHHVDRGPEASVKERQAQDLAGTLSYILSTCSKIKGGSDVESKLPVCGPGF